MTASPARFRRHVTRPCSPAYDLSQSRPGGRSTIKRAVTVIYHSWQNLSGRLATDTPAEKQLRLSQGDDVTTLNGYAALRKIGGYKEWYLAKSAPGPDICLKARRTLAMEDDGTSINRRRYLGKKQKFHQLKTWQLPLYLTWYGCKCKSKGKTYRVIPSGPGRNLMQFIDESETGEVSHVTVVVDQHDQVWVEQLKTILPQHKTITVD